MNNRHGNTDPKLKKGCNIIIDTYYDITCDRCGRHWSTDYQYGMYESKSLLSKTAYDEGWRNINGKNICPKCSKRSD